jgi:hypothetical protein
LGLFSAAQNANFALSTVPTSNTPLTERAEGCAPALNTRKGELMSTLVIQSTPGIPFDLLILQVRDWCHEHHIELVRFTYSISGVRPKICIEFRTDAEMDLFALNFTEAARLLHSPTLDFTVDYTV